jgi:hypothetical protein
MYSKPSSSEPERINVNDAIAISARTERVVTCKRGSAKHSVKDDHAFLWKHAIFRRLPSRNPLTDQDQILYD